jgi:hypothetical protein
MLPAAGAPAPAWLAWAEHLFDQFRSDVNSGKTAAGLLDCRARRLHRTLGLADQLWGLVYVPDLHILVSNRDVFSKTVF